MTVNIHLLITGKVTNARLSTPKYYKMHNFISSPFDKYLSMICSLGKLNFKSADIYLEIDDDFQDYKGLATEKEKSVFKNLKVQNYSYRLDTYSAWNEASKKIPQHIDLVLLMSNLDHVYLPENQSYFDTFASGIVEFNADSFGYVSHWQEGIASAKKGPLDWTDDSFVFSFPLKYPFGTCLVPRSFFQSWWDEDFTAGNRIIRPDNPFGPSLIFKKSVPAFVPGIELFRHLDGYGHADIKSIFAAPVRPCCSVSGERIVHRDWQRGISGSQISDIPHIPIVDFRDYFFNFNSGFYRPFLSLKVFKKLQLIYPNRLQLELRIFFSKFVLLGFMNRIRHGVFHWYLFRRYAKKLYSIVLATFRLRC